MKLVLDSSVWIAILRDDRLPEELARIRGRHQLWMDAFVAAELCFANEGFSWPIPRVR